MPLVEDADQLAAPDPAAGLASDPDEHARPYTSGKGTVSPISIPAPSPASAASASAFFSRRLSEESIRTELCEGPLLEGSLSPVPPPPFPAGPSIEGTSPFAPRKHIQQEEKKQKEQLPLPEWPSPSNWASSVAVTDRAELIERLKRGESPTWVPNRRLESMIRMRSRSPSPRPSYDVAGDSLLPAVDISPEQAQHVHDRAADDAAARLRDGLRLERPRSALHRGDFTASASTDVSARDDAAATGVPARGRTTAGTTSSAAIDAAADFDGRSTKAAWLATSPPRDFLPFASPASDHRSLLPSRSSLAELGIFSSPPSSSLSTSFVYKPPTSPLVQSQSQTDDDDDDDGGISFPMTDLDGDLATGDSGSPTVHPRRRTNQRRHTLAHAAHAHPHTFSGGLSFSAHTARPPPPSSSVGVARRDGLFPYQAHQPRRSLSSTSSHNPFRPTGAMTAPQTPAWSPRSRRVSVSSDTSPLQLHASMVGSYEESILRGRMSTTPSKPLDFLAQIGVLGLGPQCKPSLRCPPHVTIPFAAVFYRYHHTAAADDSPSPYVGTIDLENGLPNPDAEQRSRRKAVLASRRAARPTDMAERASGDDVVMEDANANADADDTAGIPAPAATRTHRRRGTTSSGPRAPPGGSYRIPEKGQLQIIIKNQNKTAVKLFLVPYDLTGMEPGTKTFIRQRSYSAPTTKTSTTTATTATTTTTTAADRPVLRYLVHLHICCPSRGRHYLYRSIRVVFANRVPDDKETLRNEATFPEPRYSPYKPVRVNPPPLPLPSTAGAAAADYALRRRSAGLALATSAPFSARVDDGGAGASVETAAAATAGPFDAFGIGHGGPPAPWSFSPLPAPMLQSGSGPGFMDGGSGSIAGRNAPVDPTPRHRAPTDAPRSSPPSSSSPLSSAASQQTSRPSSGHAGGGRHLSAGVEDDDDAQAAGAMPADGSPRLRTQDAGPPHAYHKLRRGDVGYGGIPGSPAAAAEGLLSQRLRSLDVRAARGPDPEAQDDSG